MWEEVLVFNSADVSWVIYFLSSDFGSGDFLETLVRGSSVYGRLQSEHWAFVKFEKRLGKRVVSDGRIEAR